MKFAEQNQSMIKITRGSIIRVHLPDKNTSGKCIQEGERPMVVISNDVCNNVSPVITALPLTSSDRKISKSMPTHVVIDDNDLERTGLVKKSVIMAEQFYTIDKRDIVMFMGTLPQKYIPFLEHAMKVQIGLA